MFKFVVAIFKPSGLNFSFIATSILTFATLTIAASFFFVHHQELERDSMRAQLIGKILFSNEQHRVSLDEFEHRAMMLLEHEDYVLIALIGPRAEILMNKGLPIRPDDLRRLEQGQDSWEYDNVVFDVIRNRIATTDAHEGFDIVLGRQQEAFALLNTQFLLWLVLILGSTKLLISWLHSHMQKTLFIPIQELDQQLVGRLQSETIAPLAVRDGSPINGLLININRLIERQEQQQSEFKRQLENTTQELRESLETVEIHNIDLDMARKAAVELNKLKSDFLKKTSHDLRSPLSGILGFAELLRKTNLSPDQKDFLGTIEDSTRGMLTIVNDIHDFSRLESGNLPTEKKPMDLRRLIEETLTLQAPIANEHDVELFSSAEQILPTSVLGDPLRIQQVLTNLVSNAIRFERSNFVEVTANLQNTGNEHIDLRIEISTDGLCPSDFEQWSHEQQDRDDTSKQFYSGSAMGFSIAKGIAQHMQGKVGFDNNATTRSFYVELNLDLDPAGSIPTKVLDASYQINALVFSNSEPGYRELTSRLSELGIRNQRARAFSEILDLAEHLQQESEKHARYRPLAVIEAQTSQQTLDKIMLTQTLKTLLEERTIPCVVIAPMGQLESLEKTLTGMAVDIVPRPTSTSRLRKSVLDQLGIVRLQKQHTSSSNNKKAPIRVLVVDDNEANLKLATALLQDFHVDINTAATGRDAIEQFQAQQYELVFMDIHLPDMSGYQVTTELRKLEHEKRRRTPIVALTAANVEDNKGELLLAGMDDIVNKPLTSKDLGLILDRWVVHSRGRNDPEKITAPSVKDKIPSTHKRSSTTRPHLAPLDIGKSLSLAKDDPKLASDMLTMLIDNLDEDRRAINDAAKAQDYDTLYDHIHKLFGACCYCGVARLNAICKSLDAKIKKKSLDELEQQLHEFNLAVDELLSWSADHDLATIFDES